MHASTLTICKEAHTYQVMKAYTHTRHHTDVKKQNACIRDVKTHQLSHTIPHSNDTTVTLVQTIN